MFIFTAFIRPISDNGRLLHLWTSALTCVIKGEKLSEKREAMVCVILIPRYLNPVEFTLKGISGCWSCSARLLIGKQMLLVGLTLYPKNYPKFTRIDWIKELLSIGFDTHSNRSSANNDNLNSLSHLITPLNRGIDKGSIANENSKGDKGHPCLVPRPSCKIVGSGIVGVNTGLWGCIEKANPRYKFITKPKFLEYCKEVPPLHTVKRLLRVQRYDHFWSYGRRLRIEHI